MRDIDGLLLILESSQLDYTSPFTREASILAIRNLVENNPPNQEVYKSLQAEAVAENKSLDQLGLQGNIVDGKLVITQK